MYDEALMKEVGDILKVYNLFFGYANVYKKCDGPTEFFQYDMNEVTGVEMD